MTYKIQSGYGLQRYFSTYFSVNRLEREANLFVACLLISDEDHAEYAEYPNSFLASWPRRAPDRIAAGALRIRNGEFKITARNFSNLHIYCPQCYPRL